MNLNHIFFFTAVASAALVLLPGFGSERPGARISAGIVLLIAGIAWLFVRPLAGYLAALFWFALLLLPALVRRHRRPRPPDVFGRRNLLTPVVLTLLIANVLMFLLEIFAGGSENEATLQRLGELNTDFILYGHQYWRLLSALFLHYGPIHLFFNLFALYLLGPALERELGSVAFASCYLLSGLGSSLCVVLLVKWHFLSSRELVGASGCIMGIVGAWAGILLRQRHLYLAKLRLRNIGLIVLMQIAFDLFTPTVSMAAHLGGLATGFVFGLLLPHPKPRHVIRYS